MNKDFPSALFDEIQNNYPDHLSETQNLYAQRENIIKLSYVHPLTINYNDNDKPNVLTQKFHFNNTPEHVKPILPWCLPNDLKKNSSYNIYDEINKKNNRLLSESFDFYFALCKNTRAKFYPNLLQTGSLNKDFYYIIFSFILILHKASRGKCFYTSDGYWLTPIEFQMFSGSTSSDWKSVIFINDRFNAKESTQSRKRKKKDQLTIKKLTENKNYEKNSITSSIQVVKKFQ